MSLSKHNTCNECSKVCVSSLMLDVQFSLSLNFSLDLNVITGILPMLQPVVQKLHLSGSGDDDECDEFDDEFHDTCFDVAQLLHRLICTYKILLLGATVKPTGQQHGVMLAPAVVPEQSALVSQFLSAFYSFTELVINLASKADSMGDCWAAETLGLWLVVDFSDVAIIKQLYQFLLFVFCSFLCSRCFAGSLVHIGKSA